MSLIDPSSIPGLIFPLAGEALDFAAEFVDDLPTEVRAVVKHSYGAVGEAIDTSVNIVQEYNESGDFGWAAYEGSAKLAWGLTLQASLSAAAAVVVGSNPVSYVALGVGVGTILITTAVIDSDIADAGLDLLLSDPKEFVEAIPGAFTQTYHTSAKHVNSVTEPLVKRINNYATHTVEILDDIITNFNYYANQIKNFVREENNTRLRIEINNPNYVTPDVFIQDLVEFIESGIGTETEIRNAVRDLHFFQEQFESDARYIFTKEDPAVILEESLGFDLNNDANGTEVTILEDENGDTVGYLTKAGVSTATTSSGESYDRYDLVGQEARRGNALANFIDDYKEEFSRYWDSEQQKQDIDNAITAAIVRLVQGEDFNVVINQTAAQIFLDPLVQTAFDTLTDGTDLYGTNYQQYVSNTLATTVINTITTGDFDDALQNASVQQAVNAGVGQSGLEFLGTSFTDPNTGRVITRLTPAGAGVAAAGLVFASTILNGDDINEQTVGQALIAGGTTAAAMSITTALVGTSATATTAGTAGLFASNGAAAGPVGIVIGAILGYAVSSIFGGRKEYHDETISHRVERQSDGSLHVIGLRTAGSLLRTTGNTNDDFTGNDSPDDTSGHDNIVAQAGDNEVYALGGHDHIEGRAGDDYIEAGTGNDFIQAGTGDDYVEGGAGDDRIYGQNGADSILGQEGDDQIFGGAGNDSIEGNDGDDALFGGAGDDTIVGGIGDDDIRGGQGDDILTGNEGNDEIDGGFGSDVIHGGEGNDVLSGNAGNDEIDGGAGDDNITGDDGVDVIYGGAGNDNIDAGVENDIVFGGIGNDVILGDYGNDDLFGELGNDLIAGGRGDDLLAGGEGNDLYLFKVGDGIDTIQDSEGINKLEIIGINGIEPALKRVGDNLEIIINDQDKIIVENHFITQGISEVYIGEKRTIKLAFTTFDSNGDGTPSTWYGAGRPQGYNVQYTAYQEMTQLFQASTAMTTGWLISNYDTTVTTDAVQLEYYNDVQVRSWSKTTFWGKQKVFFYDYYERFIEGSGYADRLVGNFVSETAHGDAGNDQMHMNTGDDIAYGGVDHDLIFGGEGNDDLQGDAGNDKIFGGHGDDILRGGANNDTLYGEKGTDTLWGNSGDDLLSGDDGNDTLHGEAGSDLIFGGDGEDIITAGSGDDFLNGGDGNDNLDGGSANDILFGEAGNDILFGNTGDDILIGGSGINQIDGGDGDDTLVLSGDATDYNITFGADGTITHIVDTRPGAPDGENSLSNIENIRFGEVTVTVEDLFKPALGDMIVAQGGSYKDLLDIPDGYSMTVTKYPAIGTFGISTYTTDQTYTALDFTAPDLMAGTTSFSYKLTSPEGVTREYTHVLTVVGAENSGDQQAPWLIQNDVSSMTYQDVGGGTKNMIRPRMARLSSGGYVLTWASHGDDGDDYGVYGRIYDRHDNPQGAVFQISSDTIGRQFAPDPVAFGQHDQFYVAYSSENSLGGSDIKIRQFMGQNPIFSEITVTTPSSVTHTSPKTVLMPDDEIMVVWQTDESGGNNIYAQKYNRFGQALSSQVLISQDMSTGLALGDDQLGPYVAVLQDGSVAVVYEDQGDHDGDGKGVFLARLDSNATLVDIMQVNTTTTGHQSAPTISALRDGGFVVTWNSQNQDGSGYGIYAQRFTVDFVPVGTETLVNTQTSGNQVFSDVVGLTDGGYIVTWHGSDGSGNGMYGQRFDAAGAKVGTEFLINDITSGSQYYGSVEQLTNGDVVASWLNFGDSSNRKIESRRITLGQDGFDKPESVALNYQDVGSGTKHRVRPKLETLSDGSYVMTWSSYGDDGSDYGVYGQIFSADNTAISQAFQINSETAGRQFAAAPVALDNNRLYYVAYTSENMSGDMDIKLQLFAGASRLFDIDVNTHTTSTQIAPSTTVLADGTLIVAWESSHTGGTSDIYYRAFNNETGQALQTSESLVNSTLTFDDQVGVQVTALVDGGFVFVWEDHGDYDGNDKGIFAQRYDSSLQKVGSEFQINTTITGNQNTPAITTLTNGQIVVTWHSEGQDGSGYGAFGQLFDANFTAVGSEFQINTTTSGNQVITDVTELADGGFFVVWQGPDAHGNGVFGQQFDVTGAKVGSEIQLNSATQNSQFYASVEQLENGNVVASWLSFENSSEPTMERRMLYLHFGQLQLEDPSANDVIIGTDNKDIINASYGDDIIQGGYTEVGQPNIINGSYGEDTARFLRNAQNYTITVNANFDGKVEVLDKTPGTHGEESSILSNVEHITFANKSYDLAADFDAIPNVTMAQNTSVSGDLDVPSGFALNQITAQPTSGSVSIQNGQFVIASANVAGDYTFTYTIQNNDGMTVHKEATFTVAPHSGDPLTEGYTFDGDDTGNTFVGQSQDDIFNGNEGDDVFIGYEGNNVYNGGSGNDTVQYTGAKGDYDIVLRDTHVDITNTQGDTDTLNDIESAVFSDGALDLETVLPALGVLQTAVSKSYEYTIPAGATVEILSQPNLGSVSITGGMLTYTAPTSEIGKTYFSYRLTTADGIKRESTAEVQVFPISAGVLGYDPNGPVEQAIAQLSTSPGRNVTDITELNDGTYVIGYVTQSWPSEKVYFVRYNADGTEHTAPQAVDLTRGSDHNQNNITIHALADGGFVVTYDGTNNASNGWGAFVRSEVYLQRYDAQSQKVGQSIQVNHHSDGAQNRIAATTLQNGNLVVIYNEIVASTHGVRWDEYWFSSVKMRQFDSNGNPISGEENLSYGTTRPRNPAITTLSNGNMVVTWQLARPETVPDRQYYWAPNFGSLIVGQLLDANGQKIGSEFNVINRNSHLYYTDVVSLNNGGFVVAWNGSDGSGQGVQAQWYNANAVKVGNEVVINAYFNSDQKHPDMIGLNDGGLFVTWSSYGEDGSGWAIKGQRFDNDGNTVGTNITINTNLTGDQFGSSVIETVNGELILTWEDRSSGTPQLVQRRLVPLGQGGYAVHGEATDDILIGGSGNDTLNGGAGNDTLVGGGGQDDLSGGDGDDIYQIDQNSGFDVIDNQDSAGNDTVSFGAGIEKHDVWFAQSGYDLNVSQLGTLDSVLIKNWYISDAQKVDEFTLDSGEVLTKNNVDQLVNAMAAFNPATFGVINDVTDLPTQVQSVITSNWTT